MATIPTIDMTGDDGEARLQALLAAIPSATAGGEVADLVARVIEDIRRNGDDGIVRYLREFSHPGYQPEHVRVSAAAIEAAEKQLEPGLRDALRRAIDNVRAYQRHIMPGEPPPLRLHGATLGMRFTPVDSAGLMVPGGSGAYPSTLVMLAVPAQAAAVPQLAVATPPRPGGEQPEVDLAVLGLCGLLGIQTVYRFHGAAVAALALGTESVEPVAMLAGPGNAYSQQAKRQLYGHVGVDGLYGPSEVMLWADADADPGWLAADLLAQAEHNPGAGFVMSRDQAVLERVAAEVEQQVIRRSRRGAIEHALQTWCALLLVADDAAAANLINRVAPEHLTIALREARAALPAIRHAGAIFLGDSSPVASGDYWAGPSHCLPTGRTARFSSGCSVYTFLKRSSVEAYPNGLPQQGSRDIATIALAEGFEAHAHSIRVRQSND